MSQLSKLSEIGIETDSLSSEQRAVLTSLSSEELDVLASVKRRLDTVDGDVQGHSGEADENGVIGSVVF
jgi:hypothetical protein